MKISIIVCTYNRCERLRNVLRDIQALTPPRDGGYEVVVVDNNSTDQTKAVIEAAAEESQGIVRYGFERRQGKSHALNLGVQLATGAIVAFTDDDVEIDKAWLVEIERAFVSYACMGLGGRIIPMWLRDKPSWYAEQGPSGLLPAIVRLDLGERPGGMKAPPFGANMAFRREAFERFGLFRTDLGPNPNDLVRGEDTEFGRRVLAAGEQLVYVPTMIVRHPVEAKRATKAYFRAWYFGYGQALVRTGSIPPGTVFYFRTPRYFFRGFIEAGARWLCSLRPRQRFYYELQLYLVAGQITEARRHARIPRNSDLQNTDCRHGSFPRLDDKSLPKDEPHAHGR
jgi:glycosyltransferase involved in cell wall biosynthesis